MPGMADSVNNMISFHLTAVFLKYRPVINMVTIDGPDKRKKNTHPPLINLLEKRTLITIKEEITNKHAFVILDI